MVSSTMGGISRIVVLLFALYSVVQCKLPEYIKVCPHDHQNLSACIIDSIDYLRPYLKAGIKEIDVPPMEPLELDPAVVDSQGSATRIAYNVSDIQVWGGSDFKILKLTSRVTKKGYTFFVRGIVNKLRLEAQYEINSKLLFLELVGKGPLTANITEYQFESVMKGIKVKRDGANHLVFEKITVAIAIGKAEIYLGGLFNGNEVLGKATNAVLNDNAASFIGELRPGIEKGLEKSFLRIANKITNAFTYEELFP